MDRLAMTAAGAVLILAAGAARAETLADAVTLAYDSNPTLQQQRAQVRALDETYVQALSGYRPSLSITATGGYKRSDPGQGAGAESNSVDATLTASQPLYTGGRVSAGVRSAKAEVLAARETLRSVEQQILQQVISAYVDVRRDFEIVRIRKNNIDVLKAELDETEAKFRVGQLTRTDVATVRAQYAQAKAALAAAEGQLRTSRSAYLAVVGRAPGQLAPEPALTGLPATLDQAFDASETDNPDLLAASLTEQASQALVAQAKAARMPTVSATASYDYGGRLTPFSDRNTIRTAQAGITITQPLFSGGLISSQIRQALEQDAQSRQALEVARRGAVKAVAVAWSNINAAHASLAASLEQKDAAMLAFDGVQAEFRAGLRTVFEFVQSEQAVRDAELAVVTARHDEYTADAALLAAIGRLNPKALSAAVATYDPAANFDRVRQGYGSAIDPLAGALDRLSPNGGGKPLDAHRGLPPGALKAGAKDLAVDPD
jgi:outer membrane protein